MENKTKIYISSLVLLLIGAVAIFRIAHLDQHFLEIDDAGVPYAILNLSHEVNTESIRTKIHDSSRADHSGVKKQILRKIDEIDSLDFLCSFTSKIYSMNIVSRHFTYGPAQFWLTRPLLDKEMEYRKIIFWSRFPSYLFSLLSILLLYLLLYRFYQENIYKALPMLGVVLLACSWEHTIYAMHASSYSIGVFSCVALLLLLNWQIKSVLNLKQLILSAFILVLLCHCQYQILFFIPAYFITLYFMNEHNKEFKFKRNLLIQIVLLGLMLLPLYYFFLDKQVDRPLLWNSGPNGEFNFPVWVEKHDSLWDGILFFVNNSFHLSSALLGPINENTFVYKILSYIYYGLINLGFLRLCFSRQRERQCLKLFILTTALVWVFLITKGSMSFGPTRHGLILLPILILLLCEGFITVIEFLKKYFPRVNWHMALPVFISMVVISSFIFSASSMMEERKDQFSSKKILDVITKSKFDIIMQYDLTVNISLMRNVTDKISVTQQFLNEPGIKEVVNDKNTNSILLISAVRPLDSNRVQKQFSLEKGSFKLTPIKESFVDAQFEFSSKTKNVFNTCYMYHLEKVSLSMDHHSKED